jgi:hypothetical protein
MLCDNKAGFDRLGLVSILSKQDRTPVTAYNSIFQIDVSL